MKSIILSVCAVGALAFQLSAQDNPNLSTNKTDYTLDDSSRQKGANRLNAAIKTSDLVGMTVKNYQGDKLGKVDSIAVDLESGRVVEVILTSGGFAGFDTTLSAFPPQAFFYDSTNKVLDLDVDKQKFKSTPNFDANHWSENFDSNHLSSVYGYYGKSSAYTFVSEGNYDQVDTNSTRAADSTWVPGRRPIQSQYMIPASRLGQIQKASGIIGMPVRNLAEEKLGDVDNILVDLNSGRIVAVVISSGGFLGMDGELSAVPPTALRLGLSRSALRLDTSKEMLSRAPHFKGNQWPDMGQLGYASGIYSAYNVEPYFSTNTSSAADNTAINLRDRSGQNLTPMDQGNSQADIDTTAQIRKEINDGPDMSVNAKNVKIITLHGRVTLRGPVNNSEEKRLIGEIAERIAHSGNVDNELEVKLTTSSLK